jgi:hypothetical protein
LEAGTVGPLPTRGGALAAESCVWKAAANELASETESLLKRKDGDFFEVGEEARDRGEEAALESSTASLANVNHHWPGVEGRMTMLLRSAYSTTFCLNPIKAAFEAGSIQSAVPLAWNQDESPAS